MVAATATGRRPGGPASAGRSSPSPAGDPGQARPSIDYRRRCYPGAVDPGSIVDAIATAGLRVTEPRRRVAALVAGRAGHFTAADLVADATARQLRVGRATIFRTLDALAGVGAVERVDLPSGEHAYVVCRPEDHHHHVICASCGRTQEVDDGRMADALAEVERITGFQIDSHRIELYGTCPACRQRGRDRRPPAAIEARTAAP